MLVSLNHRQREILIFLLGRGGPTIANQLATRYGASLRTIRYDLDAIRPALKGTGLRMEAKPRHGVWIEGSKDRRDAVMGLLQDREGVSVLSPQAREDRFFLELLTQDDGLTLEALGQSLNCSRTTILRCLPAVERRLRSYGLRLQRLRGRILAVGPERNRREALVRSLVDSFSPAQLTGILRGTSPQELITFPAVGKKKSDYSWKELAKVLSQTEKTLGRKFTDESFVALVVHLSVALQRLQNGQVITMPVTRLAEIKPRPEYQTAVALAADITARTGISIPEAELGFLTLHLIGSRAQAMASVTAPPAKPEADPRTVSLVERFIQRSSDWLGIDLSKDEVLRDGLTRHFQGLLTRQRFQIPITNPLKGEIRQQMARVLEVVARVMEEFRPELEAEVTEDEAGFLAIHLAAALERIGQGHGVRVLVVCSTGLGSAQLLAARLLRVLKEIHIVGVVSALESTDSGWLNQSELVVTTVPLPSLPVPQVRVSPLLAPEEVERVRKALRRPVAANEMRLPGNDVNPMVETLLPLIHAYADVRDAVGLRRALAEHLSDGRPPLELIEPVLREVTLLGIQIEPEAQVGLAIHLQLALSRYRAGQFVPEPDLERMRNEHRSLFRAVERGLQLFGRWHGVAIPEAEVVPVMRYILRSAEGS